MDMGDDMRKCLNYFIENNQDGEIIMTLRSIIQILKNILNVCKFIDKKVLEL